MIRNKTQWKSIASLTGCLYTDLLLFGLVLVATVETEPETLSIYTVTTISICNVQHNCGVIQLPENQHLPDWRQIQILSESFLHEL
jgi:hypothetical protein